MRPHSPLTLITKPSPFTFTPPRTQYNDLKTKYDNPSVDFGAEFVSALQATTTDDITLDGDGIRVALAYDNANDIRGTWELAVGPEERMQGPMLALFFAALSSTHGNTGAMGSGVAPQASTSSSPSASSLSDVASASSVSDASASSASASSASASSASASSDVAASKPTKSPAKRRRPGQRGGGGGRVRKVVKGVGNAIKFNLG